MKNILKILLILFVISSCSRNDYGKELLGTWNDYKRVGAAELRFYQDSIVEIYYDFYRSGTWDADSSQIKFHFPKKIPGLRKRYTIDYKLSKCKDSLFTKPTTESIFGAALLKVNDNWSHFLKGIGLQIDLPEADFELIRNNSMNKGIDLYVGYKSNKLIMKSIYDVLELNSLKKIESLVLHERYQGSKNEINSWNFNLIVDKNIPKKKIDSIKILLKTFPEMKIFRVYKNIKADYGRHDHYNEEYYGWNWYGRFE